MVDLVLPVSPLPKQDDRPGYDQKHDDSKECDYPRAQPVSIHMIPFGGRIILLRTLLATSHLWHWMAWILEDTMR